MTQKSNSDRETKNKTLIKDIADLIQRQQKEIDEQRQELEKRKGKSGLEEKASRGL